MIYERILKICKMHNMSITALCTEITGSSGNLPTWKKDIFKADIIIKICLKFRINADYLLFGKESSDEDEEKLLTIYRQFNNDNKAVAKYKLKKLLEEQQAEELEIFKKSTN